jgi:LPXTG-motif cell wall-anchored protein
MRISTVLGGIAAGLALTAGLAAPAAATGEAVGAECTTAGTEAKSGDVTLICDQSTKKWTVKVDVSKTETTTNATQGQGANTDQKAKGDGTNQQSCNQQMQAGQTIAGNQYCLIAKGDINLNIAAAKPADCNGATCNGLPAEVQVQCSAGQTATIEAAGGAKATYSCAKAANGTTTMKKAAAASSGDSLPVTGAKSLIITAVGFTVLAIGAALFLVARRRRVSFTA